MRWEEAKYILTKDSSVVEELQKNESEYELIKAIIRARKEKNLTQRELAELAGTKQSNISRLESGNYNPSLEFLQKITKAMGKQLEIRIV